MEQPNISTPPQTNLPPKPEPISPPLLIVTFVLSLFLAGSIGFLLGKSLSQPKTSSPTSISQVSPTPTPETPTPTPDPTANWKTYRNEKLGFSLKYPNDWPFSPVERLLSTRTIVEIEGLDIEVGAIYNQHLGRNLSPEEIIKQRSNGKKPEQIKIDDQPALYLKMREEDLPYPKPNPFNLVVIPKEKNLYILTYQLSVDSEKQTREQEIFDLILKSFKFITPTANWKTYNSDKYRFQIKHPENIEIDCSERISLTGCAIKIIGSMGAPGFEESFLNFYTKNEFEKIDSNKKLLGLQVGETKQVCELPSLESCIYKRVNDFVGLTNFKVFENYHPWEGPGDTMTILIGEEEDKYVEISFSYYKASLANGRFSKELFDLILSTFKFLD